MWKKFKQLVLFFVVLGICSVMVLALRGAIFTTTSDGSIVNENVRYENKEDVYLDGGPGPNAPAGAAGLPEGDYYFQVTDPSGKDLLSEDHISCREIHINEYGVIDFVYEGTNYEKKGPTWTPIPCQHNWTPDIDHEELGAIVVQLFPYDNTKNKGGVYKAWVTPVEYYDGEESGNYIPKKGRDKIPVNGEHYEPGNYHGFIPRYSKTDNYKVKRGGVYITPLITVRKFEDINGNGEWDDLEPEIGVDGDGWPFSIKDPLDVTNYYFTPKTVTAPLEGGYGVTEDVLEGWKQTSLMLDGAYLYINPSVIVEVEGDSEETHEVIFGNFKCFNISGRKIHDIDGDGVDDGEPGIEGWEITLLKDGQPYDFTLTDEDGYYEFEICEAGEYTVEEEDRVDWVHTSPSSFDFTVESGMEDQEFNFLNFGCFDLTVLKYYDADKDGIFGEENECTISGWRFYVYKNGDKIETLTTGEDGTASMQLCEPGDYTVIEEDKSGWQHTTPSVLQFQGVSQGSVLLEFGNVRPFIGGLTIGYWKTHTGCMNDGTPVDPMFDPDGTGERCNDDGIRYNDGEKPITLGVDSLNDSVVVNNAQEAFAIFDGADCSGTCETMLKAQLLGAKLNVRRFPGFGDALFNGVTVADIIAEADAALEAPDTSEYEQLASKLDTINNNHEGESLIENYCNS